MAIRIEAKIGDVTLRDREIEQLEIAQALGDHHRLAITFHRDSTKPLQLTDFIAPAVTVSLTDDATQTKVHAFVGVGLRCDEQHQLHGGSRFVLMALSDSGKFSKRHHVGRFAAATIGDIVANYPDVTLTSPPFQRTANYVQSGEDDFSFLARLADDHQCFVRPLDLGMEIRHGFDDKRHPLTWGKNLQALTSSVAASNHRYKGAYYEWQRKEEVLLRDRTHDAPASGAAKLTATVKDAAGALEGGLDPNMRESTARSTHIAEFRDALLRESERTLGAAVMIEGVSTNIEIVPGDTVEIQEGESFKLANAPGTVGLVRVTHLFDGHQYTNRFVATPWMNYSSALPAPRHVLHGLVTAEVTGNDDPQSAGRVRVRERGTDPDNEAAQLWARQITPFAGNGRGIAFLPEIGDQVMLAFEEGDPERPYVIGSVWNGRDVSPGPAPKRIVTKSGNQIVMDDSGVVEIFSPSGTCLVQLSNDVQGTARITIHSEGDLFLEAKERIQLKCKALVELVGSGGATRITEGDDQTWVQGKRLAVVTGGDKTQSDSKLSLIVGGTSLELDATSLVSQSAKVSSVAAMDNTVMGMMVQLNPPGFTVAPASGDSISQPEDKETVWAARENPKPTDRIKVTRDDGPKS